MTAEDVREAWADDPEGIGRAVHELLSEALAVPGAIVPAEGEHCSVRDLGDDLLEALVGDRHLAYWPRRSVVERGLEIVRRSD